MPTHSRGDRLTPRRKPQLVRAVMPLLTAIARLHRTRIEGAEHLPREGSALLLVKHRATRDTLLLAWLLYHHTRRTANYVMKRGAAGLPPGLVEAFGGIPVIRAKDVLRLQTRGERKALLARARTREQEVRRYLARLYAHDEVIVVYPEGMFYPHRLGPLDGGAVRQIFALEAASAKAVPVIPIGTAYGDSNRLCPQATFHVGPPHYAQTYPTPSAMMAAIRAQLTTLSGLDEGLDGSHAT
jgi:1-acyl-sn-glycerol-3-phosphate acyltransferase